MTRYIGRRLLLSVPTLWVVLTLIFVLVRVAPGDPAIAVLGDNASKEAVDALRARMGLNEPILIQYLRFLGGLLRGHLGESLITGQPLLDQILFVLPFSICLTSASLIIGGSLGIPLGTITAFRRDTAVDHLGRVLSLLGLSLPAFYLGILLIFLFAVRVPLFPTVGGGDLKDPVSTLRHLALPSLTLGLVTAAYITRMTRSTVLDIVKEDFIRTARAKGLPTSSILFRHALRAAAVPLISLIGLFSVSLIAGSVLTEVVFSRPGLGKLLVGAMLQRDYIALQSIAVVYAFFIVAMNLMTDLLYALVDPRIKYA